MYINNWYNATDVFNFITDNLKDNEDIFMTYLKKYYKSNNSTIFEHASDRLKDDDVFIRYMIDKCGGDQIKYASNRLKNDEYVILYALNTCGSDDVMKHISDELRDNKKFMLKIMEKYSWYDTMNIASDNLKDDDDFIIQVIKITDDYWLGYQRASPRLQKYGFQDNHKDGFGYNYKEIRNRIWKEGGIAKGLVEYHNHPQTFFKKKFTQKTNLFVKRF